MRFLRVLVPTLSALIASWVFVSFAGLMVNPASAGTWTTSLMWALLSSLVVMPILVVVHHMRVNAEQTTSAPESPSEEAADAPRPFVSNSANGSTSEWPPSEQDVRNQQ
jgi:ABC-type transport system involved in cytochrome bd biosynthesis fused ATPase/permease subunit